MADEIDPRLIAQALLEDQANPVRPSGLDPRSFPFPSGFGWQIGRERLEPWERPNPAELRNPSPLPEPYVEKRLNEMPIGVHTVLPGSMFKAAAAIPGIVVQSGRAGPTLSAILSNPMTAASAGLAGDELAGVLAHGAIEAAPKALDAADKIGALILGTPAH